MTTSSSTTTLHHHAPHYHPQRTWAHVQQRLRRNCLIGPVAFVLLVILAMPYVVEDGWQQRLPLVEAVPFFRRAKAVAFRSRQRAVQAIVPVVTGGAATDTSGSTSTTTTTSTTLGMAPAAVAEPELEVKPDDEQLQEVSANVSSTRTTTVITSTTTTKKTTADTKKRKRSVTTTEYNFPLLLNHEAFEKNPKAHSIPFRYFEAHQRKEEPSRQAVLASLKWRREKQIDTILSRPHPNYDVAKRILPHYFIGRSAVTNHVVFVQRPGLADTALAKHNGLDVQDILHQYAYVFEYCWNILHTNTQETSEGDNDLMIGIMDLQGLNLSILRKADLINIAKEIVAMIDAHYPTRAYKTYMVNAPGWFSTLYKIISPIMRETTKEKIVLYSAGKAQDEALEEALGKNLAEKVQQALRIPDKKERKQKNKKSKNAKDDLTLESDILLETEMEQEIRDFVMQRLEQEGMEMKIPVPLSS